LHLIIHTDGGARGNPGPAAAGVVVRDAEDGQVVHQKGIFLGKATNNVAEYRGLLVGLEFAAGMKADEVTVKSDSELLVKQMNGEYRVKNETLKVLFEQANDMVRAFDSCTFQHIPRGQNKEADRLVNRAINLKRDIEDAG